MKEISKITVVSLFILLIISQASARLLPTHQGDNTEIKLDGETSVEDDFSSLMGMEECGEQDEECFKRRMMVDAHLDYIYTQRHKKP
ncbi:phytosulfokines 6-like [Dorcoceras hygrometricum]|uniref:Phytosulfokine n=1 Tax=Dorcoceras hygrometricum TaxID=472368 RepID=A0A2Z7A1C8_9LAMI|nr:phytosulfokines 6-like [Dorcoceras hygrometricum]